MMMSNPSVIKRERVNLDSDGSHQWLFILKTPGFFTLNRPFFFYLQQDNILIFHLFYTYSITKNSSPICNKNTLLIKP